MAKKNLEISIGSSLDGKGFQNANKALKDIDKGVKGAGQAISSIGDQIGKMDGAVSNAVGGVSKLFDAFLAGGPVALFIAGITTAVGYLIKAFKDAKEAAKDAGKAIAESFSNSFDNAIQNAKDLINRLKEVEDLKKSDRQYYNAIENKESNSEILKIQQNAIDARRNATSKREIDEINAAEARDISIKRSEQSIASAKTKADEADKTVNGIKNRRNQLGKQIDDLDYQLTTSNSNKFKQYEDKLKEVEKYRERLSDRMEDGAAPNIIKLYEKQLRKANESLKEFEEENAGMVAIYKARQEAEKKLDELDKQYVKLGQELYVAENAKKIADLEYTTAVETQTVAINKAKETYNEQIKAIEERADAEREAIINANSAKDRAELQKQLKEKEKQLVNAEKKQAENSKSAADAAKQVELAEKNLVKALDQRKANLSMSFSDWNKNQKQQERDTAKEEKNEEKNRRRAERTLKRLKGRGSMMSRFDRAKISSLEQYLNTDNIKDAEKAAEKAKENQNIFFNNAQQMQTDISNVAKDIAEIKDKLGL